VEDYVAALAAMGREPDRRRETTRRLLANAPRLYRDDSLISAFDAFLKARSRAPIAG